MNLDYTSLIMSKCKSKEEAMKRVYPFMWDKIISLKIAMIGKKDKTKEKHYLELLTLAKKELEEYYNKACHPKNYSDLLLTAKACDYKMGWAYHKAKDFNFDIPARQIYYCHSNSQPYDYEDDYDYTFSSYAEYDML